MWDLVLVPIPLVLLTMLATYLMPSLTYMLHSLPFPPRVMSLTFLSFANAAPDLITCFTALRHGTPISTTMGIGEVIGSATFGICVVFGTVAIMATSSNDDNNVKYSGLKVIGHKWMWDIFAMLLVISYIAYTLQDGKITLFDSIVLSTTYLIIISIWIWRSKGTGFFIDVNHTDSTIEDNIISGDDRLPSLEEELLSMENQSDQLGSQQPPLESSRQSATNAEAPNSSSPLSASYQSSNNGSDDSSLRPRIQSYNATAPLSPIHSPSYDLETGPANQNRLSRRSSSVNSVASQSSDLGEFYFHTNIDNLEKGNSWRLPFIDSVRLAMVGMKKKGSVSVSRTSSAVRSNIGSSNYGAHHGKLQTIIEPEVVNPNKDDPISDDPLNTIVSKKALLAPHVSSYKVHSRSPSRSNSPPSHSKLKKKAPGIAVTDTVGHHKLITDELENKDKGDKFESKDVAEMTPLHSSHLNTDLERGLTNNSGSVIHRRRSHSLSFDISSGKVDLEGNEFSGSIHYLTPNFFYRISPIHMATKCQGIERLYNLSIIPIITLFNLVIPVPIPAELREKDVASFKWEFALTRKLFHFQLFWAPWIFTDFGTYFAERENYWNDLTIYVIIPSLILPIFSWTLDLYLLWGKPPIEMPSNVVIGVFDEIDIQPNLEMSKDESREIFPIVLSLISFAYVIKLLSLTTNLLVTLIMNIASQYNLSESLLAITIVSLANSAGDVITAAALTKLGRIDVAVSAVAGGSICYLCGGVGGVSLVILLLGTSAGSGPNKGEVMTELILNVDGQIWIQLIASTVMLLILLIVVPCRNWLVERWMGVTGISIWLFCILFGWIVGF